MFDFKMYATTFLVLCALVSQPVAQEESKSNEESKTNIEWPFTKEKGRKNKQWQMMPGNPYTPQYKVEKLSDRVYTFRAGFYRSPFIVTGDGVIVTDPLSVEAGKKMLEEIELITDEPIKYVIYSHSHWDHVAGGQPFKDKGAEFISQERCLENFEQRPNADVVMPDITFDKELTLKLGDVTLDMYYFGPNHDICLSVGVIKPENILWAVDVAPPASGNLMPFNATMADVYMYNMLPFVRSVDELIKKENIKALMGGHSHFQTVRPFMKGVAPGILMDGTLGPTDSVTRRRIFWETAWELVQAEIDAGTTLDDIPTVLADRKELSKLVADYNKAQAKILFTRLTHMYRTGQ